MGILYQNQYRTKNKSRYAKTFPHRVELFNTTTSGLDFLIRLNDNVQVSAGILFSPQKLFSYLACAEPFGPLSLRFLVCSAERRLGGGCCRLDFRLRLLPVAFWATATATTTAASFSSASTATLATLTLV
jgi:hypothetical protein